MVDDAVLEYHMNQTSVPFLSNNSFVKSLGIENDVFEPLELSFNSATGVKADGGNERTGYKYTFEENKAEIILTIKNANPGDHLYLYAVSSKAPQVIINDQLKHSTDATETKYTARTYQFMDLGYCEKNTNKLVTLKFNDSKLTGNLWLQCARVCEDGYKEMVEKLSDEQMKVLSYDSTHVEGVITAQEDGVLFLTIPYDESWVASVDGQPATLEPIDDALMGIRLKAGTHNISLSYKPSRFRLCCYITYAAIGALIFLTICRKVLEYVDLKEKYAKKEKNNEEEKEKTDADPETEKRSEIVEKTTPEPNAVPETESDSASEASEEE